MDRSELFIPLNEYLERAHDILRAWGTWLAEHERLIVGSQAARLEQHLTSAYGLTDELAALSEARGTLLAEARRAGFTCSTLKELAQSLTQWATDAGFRARVLSVEQSMAQLRRLNIAAWVLVNHCSKYVDETMSIMNSGTAMRPVYIDSPHADMIGGQILDQAI
ncbi:MAG: hypothetical protein U0892_05225 [Pirellulales bacterium]